MAANRPPLQTSGALASLPIPPGRKAEDYLLAYKGIAYSAIKAIANDVSSIKLHLYKRSYDRTGKVQFDEIEKHEALSLLYHVNPYSSFFEFIEATQIFKEIAGESFWLILRDTNSSPVEMWHLRPDWVTILPSVKDVIKGYEFRPGNMAESQIFDPKDVIHHKEFNPTRMSRGKGTVQAAAIDLDLDDFSATYTRNFFFNSAVPSLLLKFKNKINQENLERFIAQWESKFRGANQAHKIAAISGDVDVDHLSLDLDKMGLVEHRKFVRDNILSIFQVPKSVIGLTEDVNKANAEATIRAYMERVIDPKMARLVASLNEFYLKMWPDEDLFFDYDSPVPQDNELKIKMYENALKYGWMTINEVREEENYPPVEGGDAIYLPLNVSPVGDKGEDGKEDENKGYLKLKVKKVKDGQLKTFHVRIPVQRIKAVRDEARKRKMSLKVGRLLSHTIKVVEDEAKKEATWRKLIAKTDAWEVKVHETVIKLFNSQEEETLAKFNGKKAKIDIAKYLFDLAIENGKWKVEFEPILRQILKEQGRDTLDFLGITADLDVTQDEVIRFLGEESGKRISGINETTLESLRDTLADGVKEGEGISDLTKRVQKVFTYANKVRAEMIARTEVLRASNFATDQSYRQSGVVKGKEWLTAMDERTCPLCQPLDGKIVDLNKNFNTEVGAVDFPPLHPSCRCTTIPVIV